MKKKPLSKKEMLFCDFYHETHNSREAAAKAGYLFPEKSGVKLLKEPEILNTIKKGKGSKTTNEEIAAGFKRLAFGSVTDCIRLMMEEEPDVSKLEQMDFFPISEIKKPKGGGLEIKFFDRIKALEHLAALCSEKSDNSALPFYDAIQKGAQAISGVSGDA